MTVNRDKQQAKVRSVAAGVTPTGLAATVARVEVRVALGSASEAGVVLRRSADGAVGTKVGVRRDGTLVVDRTHSGNVAFNPLFPSVEEAPVTVRDGEVTFTAYLDRSSVEVLAAGRSGLRHRPHLPAGLGDGCRGLRGGRDGQGGRHQGDAHPPLTAAGGRVLPAPGGIEVGVGGPGELPPAVGLDATDRRRLRHSLPLRDGEGVAGGCDQSSGGCCQRVGARQVDSAPGEDGDAGGRASGIRGAGQDGTTGGRCEHEGDGGAARGHRVAAGVLHGDERLRGEGDVADSAGGLGGEGELGGRPHRDGEAGADRGGEPGWRWR